MNGGRSTGAAAAVFDDCYYIACDFPLSSFEHCNKDANKVVLELARLAKVSKPMVDFEPMSEIVSLLVAMSEIVSLLMDVVTVISN